MTATKSLDARVRILAGPASNALGRIVAIDEARWTGDVRLDDGRVAKGIALKHLEVLPDATITDREKLLDRVRKLHAKAESARTIGNEAEAMAFAAGVQKMLATYRLDMSELEMVAMERDEPIGQTNVEGMGRKGRVAWAELLASIVARAHYCRIMVSTSSDTIYLVGRPTDRAVAEFVFTTLRRTIDEDSDRDARAFRRNQRRNVGCTSGGNKNFRAAWINNFIVTIAKRYDDEREALRVEVAKTGTSLIRLDNALAQVDAHMKQIPTRTAKGIGMKSSANEAGAQRGRAAGERATIRGTGLGAGKASNTKLLG